MAKSNLVSANALVRKGDFAAARDMYIHLVEEYKGTVLHKTICDNLVYLYFKEHKKLPIYKKSPRIMILPKRQSDSADIIRKITYFYSDLPTLEVFILSDKAVPNSLANHPDYSSNIPDLYKTFRSQIHSVHSLDEAPDCEILLCGSLKPEKDLQNFIDEYRSDGKKVYYIDKESQRHEGSFYIHALFEYYDKFESQIDESYSRFSKLIKLLSSKKSYIFTSGPSIEEYEKFDFNDGVKLICNTITLNKKLLQKVNPDILFFADPLFHYGPSKYAAEFRDSVKQVLDDYPDLFIVSTTKYFYMLSTLFSDYKDRIVCIPVEAEGIINLDIGKKDSFFVRATDNIFTLLMLPVASAVSDEIYTIGVDGKPLSLKDKFWKYGKNTQNNHSYDSLKRLHPGFFNLDYNDFYLKHCDVVGAYINRIEVGGTKVYSLTSSYIPGLRRRSLTQGFAEEIVENLSNRLEKDTNNKILISFNPDLSSKDTGHFYAYDESIRKEAINNGMGFISLVGKDCVVEELGENYFSWFTHNSWVFGREKNIYRDQFIYEIELLRDAIKKFGDKVFIIYFYMGTPWHLEIIDKTILKPLPNTKVVINLFGVDKYLDRWMENTRFTEMLRNNRIKVCVESEALIENMMLDDRGFKIWPMMRSDVILDGDSVLNNRGKQNHTDKIRVFFACTPQREKGFDIVLKAITALEEGSNIEPVLRITKHLDNNKSLMAEYEHMKKNSKVKPVIYQGDLTPSDYEAMYNSSDIVVVPYRRKLFEYKTSGAILDGVYYGKPVLATEKTWPGDVVNEFSLGKTFVDGDHLSLVANLKELISQRKMVDQHINNEKEGILSNFSPATLVKFIEK
ncbi:MAG: glycosyltransferase [gamma proteobacterium endosymbiont of Lamellibrachia anaximandri]|nr:glycosyltransferase [gamma proteobacterium endosymbiont of Lamellibrachia anaximandri]